MTLYCEDYKNKSISLLWVSGHFGVIGNKKMDRFAIEETGPAGPHVVALAYQLPTWTGSVKER